MLIVSLLTMIHSLRKFVYENCKSVLYGTDTFNSIGKLNKKFSNQKICIDKTEWNNGGGKFKMINGGDDGVS